MCSYCGCEDQPHLRELISEHEKISALARDLLNSIEDSGHGPTSTRRELLVEAFSQHAQKEEIGLFRELELDGSGTSEVERLTGEHRHIIGGLTDPKGGNDPETLRSLVAELLSHAEMEETDLFPFAWQVLPPESWMKILDTVASLKSD